VTFLARKFISRAEEPLGTFSYQTSSRSVEIRPADWPENYFSGQSTKRSSWVILSAFYTKWFSSSIEREDSREEFKKKRKETIQIHGTSNGHFQALLAIQAKCESVLQSSIAQSFWKGTKDKEERDRREMAVKLNIAYFLAREELPFSKFEGLVAL